MHTHMHALRVMGLLALLLLLLHLAPSTGNQGDCHCPACFAACAERCSRALRSACTPKVLANQSNLVPRSCEACIAAHGATLVAANCSRAEEESFCTQLPPAPFPPRFTCEDGQCVPFLTGSFTDSTCGGRCALPPSDPPYRAALKWPWYIASSSRMLGYTPAREVYPADGSPFVPTPRWQAPSWPRPAAARYNVSLALQRGECEAAQLVVHATVDLIDLTVDFGRAPVPAASWQAMQQLYVRTVLPNTTLPGIYPDPLLPLASEDKIPLVRTGETQPIFLRLCASTTAAPGIFSGLAIVLRGRVRGTPQPFEVVVPTTVQVWQLVLPPLGPQRSLSLSADYMDSPVLQHGLYPPNSYGGVTREVWYSFLANFSIPANGNGDSGALLSLDEYKAQAAAGARWICITDVSRFDCSRFPCVGNPNPRCPGPHGYDAMYLSRMVETIRPIVEGMTAEGYADRLYAYGFDESLTGQLGCDMAPSVRQVFGAVKQAFPNLTTVSAGFGYKAWGHTPPLDLPLDIWVEDFFTWCWNDTMIGSSPAAQQDCRTKQAEVAAWRQKHGYWWYWAGAPRPGPNGVPDGPAAHPYWLNPGYVGWPPIGARLLMWLAVGHGIEGILYYATDGWNSQGPPKILRRMNNTMLTDPGGILWAGGNATAGRDGDGALLYPGPDGPLPSVRLLNIADGVEDAQLFVRDNLPGHKHTRTRAHTRTACCRDAHQLTNVNSLFWDVPGSTAGTAAVEARESACAVWRPMVQRSRTHGGREAACGVVGYARCQVK